MIDYGVLANAIRRGCNDAMRDVISNADAIGEAFGRGWRRANPPAGLVGRRCRFTARGVTKTGTIRHVYDDPGDRTMLLIEHFGELLWCRDDESVALLPWMADEQSDEVSDG